MQPQHADAKNNLGVLYCLQAKTAEAIALFRQAVHDNPLYVQAYVNWGIALADEGRYADAREQFENAIKLSPELPAAHAALALLRSLKTDPGGARDHEPLPD